MGLEMVSFSLSLKKRNGKECSDYCATAIISCASKIMLKILQLRLQQFVNRELPDVQAAFRKGWGVRDPTANICWIIGKVTKFQKRYYICSIDYSKAFDYVNQIKLWKILKEVGIPDYLPCFLRSLYWRKEARVGTRLETRERFKTGKGGCQDCILSPHFFNLYAEYITTNARLNDSQVESRLLGEISTNSGIQMIPLLQQKTRRNLKASWWGRNRRVKKLA